MIYWIMIGEFIGYFNLTANQRPREEEEEEMTHLIRSKHLSRKGLKQ